MNSTGQNKVVQTLLYILPLLVFLIVAVAFNGPVLEGKQLKAHDDLMARGASREAVDFHKETGEYTLWTDGLFGGMPTYLVYYVAKKNFIEDYIYNPVTGMFPTPINFIFISMVCFYAMMLCFRSGPLIGAFGAIVYGLASYTLIVLAAGHYSKVLAVAFIPLVIGGIALIFDKKYIWGAVLTSVAMALELRASHPQMTYYFFAFFISFLGVYFVVKALVEKEYKHLLIALVLTGGSILVGTLTHMNRFMPIQEYSQYSTRGPSELKRVKINTSADGLDKSYILAYSFGKDDIGSLFIPNYKGPESGTLSQNPIAKSNTSPKYRQMLGNFDQYWGGQDASGGPVYMGVLVFFLSVMAVLLFHNRIKYALLAAILITLFLSMGKNYIGFSEFFIDHFPLYNKFRAVSSILVVISFCIPMLGMLGLMQIIKDPSYLEKDYHIFNRKLALKNLHVFFICVGLTTGVAILMYVAPGTFQSFFKPGEMDMYEKSFVQAGLSESDINGVFSAVEAARVAIFRADTLRSIVILLLGTGMIFFFYRKKFHPAILISVLALITLVDIWGVDRRVLGSGNYVDKTKLKKESAPTTADNSILQDKSPDYRVLNLAVNTFSDNTTSFHHKSVGGYHGAKMKRYQQLTEYYLMAEIQAFASTNPTTLENLMASLSKTQVLNMLNTKYIILDPGQPALRNPYAFGAAWLVSNVVYVPDADSELESLSKYDLHTTAVVDERFKGALEGLNPVVDSTAKISLVSYAPNHLEYSFNSAADQLAVFSEVFYDKGWNAYIDGSPVDHVRADFVLRAMRVPKGTHKIEFDFDPASVKKGETYSLIGSLLIILGFIGGIVLEFRKRKAATTPNK